MAKRLAIANVLSVLLVLFVNYYSQTGNINNQTVGGLSDRYSNLFTPAGYAFAIWGIIFLSLIAYSAYQLFVAFRDKEANESHLKTGYWFALVNVANASWVVAWLYELTGLSVLIMLFMLVGLSAIIVRTNMERWDAPAKIIALVWWPICIYAGWIAVATIANIAAYLSKLDWRGGPMGEETWTIVMILVATAVNTYMIWKRSMREFALVGVWALLAIYVRHQGSYPLIATTAVLGDIFLIVNTVVHGAQNWRTNPIVRSLGLRRSG